MLRAVSWRVSQVLYNEVKKHTFKITTMSPRDQCVNQVCCSYPGVNIRDTVRFVMVIQLETNKTTIMGRVLEIQSNILIYNCVNRIDLSNERQHEGYTYSTNQYKNGFGLGNDGSIFVIKDKCDYHVSSCKWSKLSHIVCVRLLHWKKIQKYNLFCLLCSFRNLRLQIYENVRVLSEIVIPLLGEKQNILFTGFKKWHCHIYKPVNI